MTPTFLFYNIWGENIANAVRVKAEGFPVYVYKRKGQDKSDAGIGLFEKEELIDDVYEVYNKFQDKKDELITIVDDNGYGDQMDFLRNNGWKVIGGSAYCDTIEHERGKGLELMKEIGLDIPYEKDFDNIGDAIDFLEGEDNDCRYVFKPEGEEFAGSSRTYTGKNKQDLLDYLKWTKADIIEKHTDITKFVLQEFVEGIEADFSAYVSHGKFMDNIVLIDIEEKKSGDGNKGQAEGCMGNIIVNVGKSKYFDMYLKPLEKYLTECDYTGCISLNNIFATKTGGKHQIYQEGVPYGLEFTPRFGWDAHLTEGCIIKDAHKNLSDFYITLANGTPFDFPIGKVGCGIRVYTASVGIEKKEIQGRFFSFEKSVAKNLWFYGVSYKHKSFMIENNPVLVVNTSGKNLTNTISDAYYILKEKVNVPDVYYRMEIGKRADDVLKFLSTHEWI